MFYLFIANLTNGCSNQNPSATFKIRNDSILGDFTYSALSRSSNTAGVISYGSYLQQIRWPQLPRKKVYGQSPAPVCPYMSMIYKIIGEIWIKPKMDGIGWWC